MQVNRHRCNIALFAMAQMAEIGPRQRFTPKKFLIFDFFEDDAQRFQQFWFEHYPAEHKLRSVVPLAVFYKNKKNS